MKISDIYKEYKTMPQVQSHMLKVAGIGAFICDNFRGKIDKELVISVGLLHDMGNNLKSNFITGRKELKIKGVEYWKKVKQEYIDKYGENADLANFKILKELNVPQRLVNVEENIGHLKINYIHDSKDYELKIVDYANWRAGLNGVISLDERIDDFLKRYLSILPSKDGYGEKLTKLLKGVEKQIFDRCNIAPDDVKESTIKPYINKLINFDIKLN